MRLRFALPIFLGSALLFCVQPMLGRALLPLFGGTASVWTVCLVAYQALLVAGSVYADRLGRRTMQNAECRMQNFPGPSAPHQSGAKRKISPISHLLSPISYLENAGGASSPSEPPLHGQHAADGPSALRQSPNFAAAGGATSAAQAAPTSPPQAARFAHIAALAVSALWVLLFAHFRPGLALLVPDGGEATRETGAALLCVLAAIGLPYVVLSAGSSLVQKWAEESVGEGRETYRLYVVSNIGSFAGLLAYPLAIEPFVPQTWQWRGFAAGIALYAALCARAAAARRTRNAECGMQNAPRDAGGPPADGRDEARPSPTGAARSTPPGGSAATPLSEGGCGAPPGDAGILPAAVERELDPPVQDRPSAPHQAGAKHKKTTICYLLSAIYYLRGKRAAVLAALLPALSTAILDATTTHLSSDVSPFPLMWVVLLGLFLLSYAIGFSRLGERLLPLWFVLAAASAVYAVAVMRAASEQASFARNFAAGCLVILFGGCFLHGWLCRLRPEGGQLTRFYLCIALGGAAGGLLGGMAPVFLFDTVAEYPMGLFLLMCAIVAAPFLLWREPIARAARFFKPDLSVPAWQPALAAVLALLVAGAVIRGRCGSRFPLVHERGRTFYGTWVVARDLFVVHEGVEPGMKPPTFPATVLVNGNTTHGLEAEAEVYRGMPTTYYGEKAGGLAFTLHPKYADTNAPMRVALVGMGAGTQAWYGRLGDAIRFFEIDGAMVDAAQRHFSFLRKSKAEVDLVVADARKALEREARAGEPKYDVLVVDAYSGDSVPLHLLTGEAFDLYASRLAPDGVLALHITNWHVDLLPVAKAAASRLGLPALGIGAPGDGLFRWDADWVFLSRQPLPAPRGVVVYDWDDVRDIPLPTDDLGSILPYVVSALRHDK